MKTISLMILFTMATISAIGQSRNDQTRILQQCIDLPDLQQYYPYETDGVRKPVYILQHGVSFPSDIEVSKFGKRVQLVDKAQLSYLKISSYFLFWEFKTDQNSAQVDFVYNFINADNLPRMKRVNLELQKNNETWTVSKTKIEER